MSTLNFSIQDLQLPVLDALVHHTVHISASIGNHLLHNWRQLRERHNEPITIVSKLENVTFIMATDLLVGHPLATD